MNSPKRILIYVLPAAFALILFGVAWVALDAERKIGDFYFNRDHSPTIEEKPCCLPVVEEVLDEPSRTDELENEKPLTQTALTMQNDSNSSETVEPKSQSLTQPQESTATAQYGTKVLAIKDARVHFPDFDLTYTGTTSRSVPNNKKLSITFHHYELERNGVSGEVRWSSGLGEIAPIQFDFDGKKYAIERAISDTVGSLSENEIVITGR